MAVSRREFLTKSAKAAAAYPAMFALGMLRPAPAHAFNLAGSGNGKKVVILGPGLSAMAAAYELGKLRYNCTILEARQTFYENLLVITNESSINNLFPVIPIILRLTNDINNA